MYYGNNIAISFREIDQLSEQCEKRYNFIYDNFLNELTLYENCLLQEAEMSDKSFLPQTIKNNNSENNKNEENNTSNSSNEKIKNSFLDTIKKVIDQVIKFFVEIFKKIGDFINKIVDKIKYNTIQDKFTKLLLKDITFKNLEKAKENGWQGFDNDIKFKKKKSKEERLRCPISYINLDPLRDYTHIAIKDIFDEYKFSEIENIVNTDFRFGALEDTQDKLDKIKKEISATIKKYSDPFSNLSAEGSKDFVASVFARMEYDNIRRVREDDTEESYNQRIYEFFKKYPAPMFYKTREPYPSAEEFESIKDCLFNNKKIQNDINKNKDELVKGVKEEYNQNKNSLKNLNSKKYKDTSEQEYQKVEIEHLKCKIKINNIKMIIYKGVTTNFINLIKLAYIVALSSYDRLCKICKKYNALKV